MATGISIIICTRNRADSLRQTLVHLNRCHVPKRYTVELLVVDNGSTDHTRRVVEETTFSRISVRYVPCLRAGKMYALNLGIAEAAGDIILSTDDDVQPTLHWIEAICRPIVSQEADATQGPIACDLVGLLPAWYDQAAIRGFAEVNFGQESRLLPKFELIGANMAFSKACVERIGLFNTLLGPGRCGFYDDTEFSWRLEAAGFKAMYCPDAGVVHRPIVSRLTLGSLRREWFSHGVSAFVATRFHLDRSFSLPLAKVLRQGLRNAKLAALRVFRREPYRTTQDEMFFWMSLGTLSARRRGLARIARQLGESTVQPPRKIVADLRGNFVAR